MKRSVFFICLFLSSISLFSQSIMVEVIGIRNKDGLIRLAFFTDEAGFRAEQPAFERTLDKSKVLHGNLTAQLDSIPPGVYGIALLDDENKNGKLDYKFLLPKEGVGFSNYEHHGFRKPRFDDFSFILKRSVTLRISIRLLYY